MDKRLVKRLLNKENPTILEIGAHRGSDSLAFLEEFPKIKLYCFEPDPRAIEKHKIKVQDQRCQLYEIAVSNQNGTATFYQSTGYNYKGRIQDASSSLKTPKDHLEVYPHVKFEQQIAVQTVKLDTWIKEQGVSDIDFIWADVQGAEKELIEGGREALAIAKYFYTEFHPQELYEGQIKLQEIKKMLPDYQAICLCDHNVLLKNTKFLKFGFLEVLAERIMTNAYIYQYNRSAFHLPLNTGLRKYLEK